MRLKNKFQVKKNIKRGSVARGKVARCKVARGNDRAVMSCYENQCMP